MRRILVPLDGTQLAESILSDARRLAGPDGVLILIEVAQGRKYDPETRTRSEWYALQSARDYLAEQAASLRAEGVNVEAHGLYMGPAPVSIDDAVGMYRADMIACATHGRSPLGRLCRGGVAWRALAHSSVPVLLRHAEDHPAEAVRAIPRHIMVPLDGSAYAEKALPLAQQLAREWKAKLSLVQVVPDTAVVFAPEVTVTPDDIQLQNQEAHRYLDRMASELGGEVQMSVLIGPVSTTLTEAAVHWSVSDIVMASHGRTGLSRVILGSVADTLVHRLHCPIIVIPAMVAETPKHAEERRETLAGVK